MTLDNDQKIFCTNEMRLNYEIEQKTEYEKKSSLQVQQIFGAVVHPFEAGESCAYGGVTDELFNFIDLGLTKRVSPPNFNCEFTDWYVGANVNMDHSQIDFIDEDVVFIGALPFHYGHFITEGLSRIWYYLDLKNTHLKAVYISEGGEDRFFDFFNCFGIENQNLLKITKPTKFRSVFIPEQSIRLHDFFHFKYKETIDKIKADIPPRSVKKVFFSKSKSGNGRGIGEAPIEEIFSKNDFEVFYPESLSVRETISVLRGCDVFAATSGTNIHNSVFMEDERQIICLNRSAHFHPLQTMIDKMKNLNSIYVDAFIFSSDKNFGNSPCLLFPTTNVLSFFNFHNFRYNKWVLITKAVGFLCDYLIFNFFIVPWRKGVSWLQLVYVNMNKSDFLIFRLAASMSKKMYNRIKNRN